MNQEKDFFTYIRQYIKPDPTDLQLIESLFTERSISKNAILIDAEKICSSLFFVKKGALRSFYETEEKEVTYWFATEGMFATSFYSFISRKIGFETIQCLEDSLLVEITYDKMQYAFSKSQNLESLWRKVSELYYLQLEERTYNFQLYNAKERYDILLEKYPDWPLRFSLGHIASYLGISQETLSRIRAKK